MTCYDTLWALTTVKTERIQHVMWEYVWVWSQTVGRASSYFTICCDYFPTFSRDVLSSRGKSCIPPPVSVAQRHWFQPRNWKIIKSSFCFLCVCCKAPASPYAFQIYLKQLYTVKRRRQQDNDKVSDIWKCKEWNSAFNRKTLLHFNALGLEHWYDMFGFELFKYS